MEEWEQTAKQFKSNAEFLESLCQDKLTHLYHDKRKTRKNYQEEHQRIASQFTNVSIFHFFCCFSWQYLLSFGLVCLLCVYGENTLRIESIIIIRMCQFIIR